MDYNHVIRLAYFDGVEDRKDNPSAYDEQVENYFIFEAFKEGQSDRRLYGNLYDSNLRLADIAKWAKIYRDEERSFLAI